MNIKNGFIFLGFIFIIEAFWALSGGEVYFKYHGWQILTKKAIFGFFMLGLIFISFGIFYKLKYPEFMRCKKCKKVYNYVDIKDKSKICPKCGGELQDYAQFEKEELKKKNKELEKYYQIEKEFLEKMNKDKK